MTVHYEGTLAETGEVFDTTHEDNSIFTFELGKGEVIKAWDIALKTMKVEKKYCGLVIPFNYQQRYAIKNVADVFWILKRLGRSRK